MTALAEHRPTMATVLDWEQPEQLGEVLSWAEEAAQFVERVLIVPKVLGGIDRLPRRINGKDVVLAFSVPTKYGGTSVPTWEFAGWPVHLLGGSPDAQMHHFRHLGAIADVISADGNYHMMKANRFCEYWQGGRWIADGRRTEWDAPAAAFQRSCENIMAAWG